MAKQSSAEKYKALIGVEFEGVEQSVKKLEPLLKKLGAAMPEELEKGFGPVLKKIDILKKKLSEATEEGDLGDIEKAMERIVDEASKLGATLGKTMSKRGKNFLVPVGQVDKEVAALKRLRDGMKQTNAATQRTSLASQNMLRVLQDSPFGMLGMANNFQMLGEDISRGVEKGIPPLETLKNGLKNLIMGPMSIAAVIAVGTILIQKWDEISAGAEALAEKLEGVADAQRRINDEAREFNKLENYQKYLQTLDDKEIIDARTAAYARLHAMQQKMKDAGEVEGQYTGLLGALRGGVAQAANFATGTQVFSGTPAMVKQYRAALQEVEAAEEDYRKRMEENARRRRDGIDTEDDEAVDKQLEKEERLRRDRLLIEEKYREELEKEVQKSLDKVLDATEKEIDAEIDAEYRKLQEMKKLAAEHAAHMRKLAQELRREIQNINKDVAVGDAQASFFGAAGFAGSGFGTGDAGAKAAQVRATAQKQRDKLVQQMTVREQGMREMREKMKRAQEIGDQTVYDTAQNSYDMFLAQHDSFATQMAQNVQKEQDDLVKIRKEGFMKSVQYGMNTMSSFGSMLSSIAATMETETAAGIKKQKAMLKKAAYAQAIAASVAIFKNVAEAQTGNPLAYVAAAAAMGATMMALKAQIHQIDTGGEGSSGTGITGGFVALNQNVAANRSADFTQDQQRLQQVSLASGGAKADSMAASMHVLAEKIQDQKVVVDRQTALEIKQAGDNMSTRRIQTTG